MSTKPAGSKTLTSTAGSWCTAQPARSPGAGLMHSLGHNVFRSALQLILLMDVWHVKKHALHQTDVGRQSCLSAETGSPKLDQSKMCHTSPKYMSMRAG